MKTWKVLDENGKPFHGGSGQYSLPKNGKPGGWMPKIDNVIVCQRGYHSLRKTDVVHWFGPTIWEAETRGPLVKQDNKIVSSEIRIVRKLGTWNERTARLFACDCAEKVLPLFEKENPNDLRVRECIEVARRFANGEASEDERDATRDAARAAGVAAWVATGDAGVAAWVAAGDAARAAGAAARDAQTKILWRYLYPK